MHPSVFKAFSSVSYWPWAVYPMGKHALILKGSANRSAILVATVRVLCSYHRAYLYFYPVPYYTVSLCGNTVLLSRLCA